MGEYVTKLTKALWASILNRWGKFSHTASNYIGLRQFQNRTMPADDHRCEEGQSERGERARDCSGRQANILTISGGQDKAVHLRICNYVRDPPALCQLPPFLEEDGPPGRLIS